MRQGRTGRVLMLFVIFINAAVMLFVALLMSINALVYRETAGIFELSFWLSGVTGLALLLATMNAPRELRRGQTFLLTSSVWFTAAATGALPLLIWGLGPADAIFEAVSGITTTGSTVMSGLDDTPHGILMWRAVLQVLGGIGFVVTGMALLPILRVGGMQLFRTESSDKGARELATATGYAAATMAVYFGLIALCGLTYHLGGMSAFDAAVHALTTLSTGGFSNYDASFGHFTSPFLQWAGTFFMLAGGLPFAWYMRIYTRRTLRSEQVRMMLLSLAVVISAMTIWMVLANGFALWTALRLVAFNVISVVTTTGYATTDYLTWGPVMAVAFFLLTPVGGCTGSTAGGAKAMRWIIIFRALGERIRLMYYPHSVAVMRYEGRPVSDDVVSGVMSFFAFYFGTVAVLAIILSLSGLDLSTAVSGALTAVANVGPGVGDIIGPAGNFETLSGFDKLVLSFGMFAGRLEMLTLFVLLVPAFWREI